MLVEISCSRFRENPIHFRAGLNVILGDDQGSNSIGKSTVLMLVDFAHGGNDLLDRSPEVALNLGDHAYQITFLFGGVEYVFSRHTARPNSVVAIVVSVGNSGEWNIQQYTAWLKRMYGAFGDDLTFRQAVSPQTRVWKRDTLDVERPLQAFSGESQSAAVDRLLMLFGAYSALRELERQVETLNTDKKNLANAQKSRFITNISKSDYQKNEVAIRSANSEIERIRVEASTLALNIRQLVNDEVLDASLEKERLLKLRLQLKARRQRAEMNLDGIGAPKRAAFQALIDLFPQLNLDRLGEIEGFHRELARVLKHEIETERAELDKQLELVDGRIGELNTRISAAVSEAQNPSFLVDRVLGIAAEAHRLRQANEFYDRKQELSQDLGNLRKVRDELRTAQLRRIEVSVNDHIRESALTAFPIGRRPPQLQLAPNKYEYDVDQDTGTGTSYAALVLLDLALLHLTPLPFVVHDSVLLKNIEVPVMAALVGLYGSMSQLKQIFIAIDEVPKYGEAALAVLADRAVVKLSRRELLYDLDWRSKRSQ